MFTTTETTCYCGKPADKYSSGRSECWDCWNWRKLDGPAARYWVEKINSLFELGPDMYDLMNYFPAAGLSKEEVKAGISMLDKLLEYSKQQIEAHK